MTPWSHPALRRWLPVMVALLALWAVGEAAAAASGRRLARPAACGMGCSAPWSPPRCPVSSTSTSTSPASASTWRRPGRPTPRRSSCCTAGPSTGGAWRHVIPELATTHRVPRARPARVRLVLGALGRLREGAARHRPPGACSTRWASSASGSSPTTGARGPASWPACARRSASRASSRWPSRRRTTTRRPGRRESWRFAYQVALAAPGLGRRSCARRRWSAHGRPAVRDSASTSATRRGPDVRPRAPAARPRAGVVPAVPDASSRRRCRR